MNALLPQTDLRFALLPPNLYPNGTNGGLSPHSLLYHANNTLPQPGTTSLELKIEVLEALTNGTL